MAWFDLRQKGPVAMVNAVQPAETNYRRPPSSNRRLLLIFATVFAIIGGYFIIRSFAASSYKQLDFGSNPNWQSLNNQPTTPCSTLGPYRFGYSATNYVNGAGSTGEIGGPTANYGQYKAYYAKKLPASKNLDKPMYASGSLIIPNAGEDASVQLGWFNSDSTDWRTNNFLGLRITDAYSDAKPDNGVGVDFATKSGLSGGLFLLKDGAKRGILASKQKATWTLDYQPSGGDYGVGIISLTITSSYGTFRGTNSLTQQQRQDGATFDHFGIFNMQFGGNAPRKDSAGNWDKGATQIKTIYADDLTLNIGANDANVTDNFASDPGWEGMHNNDSAPLQDCWVRYRQDFGWSNTASAGGSQGEIGGIIWNGVDAQQSYYADSTSTLRFNHDALYATGRLTVNHAHPDTDIPYIGWFNKATSQWGSVSPRSLNERNFVGVRIGGTSRQGHNLQPAYFNDAKTASIYNDYNSVEPKTIARNFWVCYVPNADASGNGRITAGMPAVPSAGLPQKVVSITVKAADKTAATTFDSFGIVTPNIGGAGFIQFYLDDLRYTVAPGDSGPTDRCGPTVGQNGQYSVSGMVFNDTNNNGRFDGSDAKLGNETVYLRSVDGNTIIAQKQTDTEGRYQFDNLSNGQYRIQHAVPAGYQRTTDDSRPIEINNGNYSWDFGVYKAGGDQVNKPVPAGYNTRNRTDAAIYRPTACYTGECVWAIRGAGVYYFGHANDIPVPGDYNGDGRADVAVFRNGDWHVRAVGDYMGYGQSGDAPVPADYNGDGKTDPAVFRSSQCLNGECAWHIRGVGDFFFGHPGDIPVPADYNGDGKTDVAVFRPSSGDWHVRAIGDFNGYGQSGDIPVPGDYNGDRRAEPAIYRPSQCPSDECMWHVRGVGDFGFGHAQDKPIPADYNGDSRAEIAVFRPGTGNWHVRAVGDFKPL